MAIASLRQAAPRALRCAGVGTGRTRRARAGDGGAGATTGTTRNGTGPGGTGGGLAGDPADGPVAGLGGDIAAGAGGGWLGGADRGAATTGSAGADGITGDGDGDAARCCDTPQNGQKRTVPCNASPQAGQGSPGVIGSPIDAARRHDHCAAHGPCARPDAIADPVSCRAGD